VTVRLGATHNKLSVSSPFTNSVLSMLMLTIIVILIILVTVRSLTQILRVLI